MYKKLDCIALRTVRYSDRNSILSAYSDEMGRVSLLVPAGTGRQAARMRALLMPLGRFECVADIRPGKEIFTIRDVRPIILPPAGDPLRSTLAIFITDFLSSLLRESTPDRHLFRFLAYSVECLCAPMPPGAIRNFHLMFLLHLSRFVGIEPDWHSFTPGAVFDIQDGIFRTSPPPHRYFLPSGEAATARLLSRMTPRTARLFNFSRFERNTILDRMILYYQTHFPSLATPSSLQILRMMAD